MNEKIELLLKSQQAANNLLAYQLLQSQFSKKPQEALEFIFEYQIEQIREEDSGFTLDFDSTQARFYFVYEYDSDYGMEHVGLVLELIQKEKSIAKEKRYVGTLSYNSSGKKLKKVLPQMRELFEKLMLQLIELLG